MKKFYILFLSVLACAPILQAQNSGDDADGGLSVIYKSDMTDWNLSNFFSGNPWTVWSQEDDTDLWGMPADIEEKTGCTDGIDCKYDASEDSDAWAVSPAIRLAAGTEYRVSVWVMDQSADNFFVEESEENWKLCVAGQNSVDALRKGTTLINQRGFNNSQTLTKYSKYFTPDADGDYYFALNCYSEADQYGVGATGFEITSEDALSAVGVVRSAEAAAPVYFDLTGRMVAKPSKGEIYVCKSGNEIRKIIF